MIFSHLKLKIFILNKLNTNVSLPFLLNSFDWALDHVIFVRNYAVIAWLYCEVLKYTFKYIEKLLLSGIIDVGYNSV